MKRYGCKGGLPHDLKTSFENGQVKWEVCSICNKKYRWNKRFKGRIDNKKYLEAHARNYAQQGGRTHQLFMQLYQPDKCIIHI